MSNHNDNDSIDNEISSLYEESKTLTDEEISSLPPANIDAALKAAARKAVHSRPRSSAPFSGKWQVPASLAAVLVITVGVVNVIGPDADISQSIDSASLFDESRIAAGGRRKVEQPAMAPDPVPALAATPELEDEVVIVAESLPSAPSLALSDQGLASEADARKLEKTAKQAALSSAKLKPKARKKAAKKIVGATRLREDAFNQEAPASAKPSTPEEANLKEENENLARTQGIAAYNQPQPTSILVQNKVTKELSKISALRVQGDLVGAKTKLDDLIKGYKLLSKKPLPLITSSTDKQTQKEIIDNIIKELIAQGRPVVAKQLKTISEQN